MLRRGNNMNFILSKFLSESNGSLSSLRLLMFVWVLGVFVVWATVSVKVWAPAELPDSVITVLGLLCAGKVIQKPMEKCGTTLDPTQKG